MARTFFAWISQFGPYIALFFQGLLISRYFDSRNRDYPLATVFSFLLFFLTLTSIIVPQMHLMKTRDFFRLYTMLDLIIHILLLIFMLQLLRETLSALACQSSVTVYLSVFSFAITVLSYYYLGFQTQSAYLRFFRTRQVVSFWLVLVNLYWWTLLLRRRQLDRRILLLSAGIGLLMTGQVMGDGISTIYTDNASLQLFGAVVMYGSHCAYLYVWFNAFRPAHTFAAKPASS
ncbi:MAG: hypothetical protein ACK5TN_19255 [Acidobacteriota bacterium]